MRISLLFCLLQVTRCIVEVLSNALSKPNAPPINPECKEILKKSKYNIICTQERSLVHGFSLVMELVNCYFSLCETGASKFQCHNSGVLLSVLLREQTA